MQSRARVYADVNVTRPRDYWDYETLTIQWGCGRPSRLYVLCLPAWLPSAACCTAKQVFASHNAN